MIVCADATKYNWPEVDVCITDPPYAPRVHKSIRSCAGKLKNGVYKPGVRQNDLGFEHLTPELRQWTCSFVATMVRRWAVIFSDIESVGAWRAGLEEAGAEYVRAIPWIRWSAPQFSGDRPPQGCEMIVVAWGTQRGRKRWNGPGNHTHYDHRCLRGEDKHRAEKPLDLGLSLVSHFSNAGDLVADPFAGIGTFSLAAHTLGRREISTELDEMWAGKAMSRLADANRSGQGGFSRRDFLRFEEWRTRDRVEQAIRERCMAQSARVRMRATKT